MYISNDNCSTVILLQIIFLIFLYQFQKLFSHTFESLVVTFKVNAPNNDLKYGFNNICLRVNEIPGHISSFNQTN